MTAIEELEQAAATVAGTVGPATVRIGRQGGRGAGVVTAAGLVVTNAHNLRGPQTTVTFADGRSAIGDVKGVDSAGDLAAVAVDTGTVAPITWAEETPALGAPVWAVVPTPDGRLRVTAGAISSTGRSFPGPEGRLIAGGLEHTAPLARGSSGGPLVTSDGRVVGLNTHRLGDGFYLAVAVDADLRRRIDDLAAGHSPQRRRLGVALAPPQVARRLRAAVGLPDRPGLLVRGVVDDGPAARAGVRRGDLICSAGGADVATVEDLLSAVDSAGATLTLGLARGADELTVEVDLGPVSPGGDGGGEGPDEAA